ncbi:hypothetical protein [Mycoplasma phocoenae]|uniref:Uncharacterized protein n=1 Tax=Mycoplasma phocoenae TaxID=754517 RepID=A0A858U7L6_9MOLU|nr:hypothetical protein [Mycoplasma phocoenae]QJG66768.1 hypothetical protein HGG69_00265 [Mycoplasma phocoenae]
MGVKTKDIRRNDDIATISTTKLVKDFVIFSKDKRVRKYPENELFNIFKNIVWMSEVDRKTINKRNEIRMIQSTNLIKSKSKDFNYPKWSADPKSEKVTEVSLINRLIIISAAISALILLVVLILFLTGAIGN